MALHLVQLGEPQVFEDKRDIVQRLRYLMGVLRSLNSRYKGAQFVTRIIDAIILFVTGASQPMWANETVQQEDLIKQVLEVIKNGLAAEMILD